MRSHLALVALAVSMFSVEMPAYASYEGAVIGTAGGHIEFRLPERPYDMKAFVTISGLDVECDDDLSSPTEPSPKRGSIRRETVERLQLSARVSGKRRIEGFRHRSDGDTETYIEVRGRRRADGRFQGVLTYRTLTLAGPSSPGSTCYTFLTGWRAEHQAPAAETAGRRGPRDLRPGRDKPAQQQWTTNVAGQPQAGIRFAVVHSSDGQARVRFEPEDVEIRCDNGRTPSIGTGYGTTFRLDGSGRFRRVGEYLDEYGGWGLYSLHGHVASRIRARGTLLVMSHEVDPFGGPQHSCTSDGPIRWSAHR